jgi:hypothetical protein
MQARLRFANGGGAHMGTTTEGARQKVTVVTGAAGGIESPRSNDSGAADTQIQLTGVMFK